MVKMEIDLTEEQMEKVKQLEAQGMTVGEAIDLLFKIKTEALSQIEEINDNGSLFTRIKDSTLDVEEKADVLDENYGEADKTYEMKAQDVKHKISWAKDVFKF